MNSTTDIFDFSLKLCFTGNISVGKTSLMLRYSTNKFDEPNQPSIGFDFKIKKISINSKNIKLSIWDQIGQEKYYRMTKSHYRGVHGCLFVFDLCDRKSFEDIEKWYLLYLELGNGSV